MKLVNMFFLLFEIVLSSANNNEYDALNYCISKTNRHSKSNLNVFYYNNYCNNYNYYNYYTFYSNFKNFNKFVRQLNEMDGDDENKKLTKSKSLDFQINENDQEIKKEESPSVKRKNSNENLNEDNSKKVSQSDTDVIEESKQEVSDEITVEPINDEIKKKLEIIVIKK